MPALIPLKIIVLIIYHFLLPSLPLLSEDYNSDVGEHEGVNHQHYQDRTCDAALLELLYIRFEKLP